MSTETQPRTAAWKQKIEADFLAAYEENADALFRHIYVRIRDREIATDIVQEAYSRTWLYLSEGKEIAYIKAFLYRVANNLLIDGIRKKRSTSLDSMIESDGFEPADESNSDPSIPPEARRALQLLEKLDENYRTVISMRFIDEMSPKEIARILGVSENVVSVRIHRGIEQLGKLINTSPSAN